MPSLFSRFLGKKKNADPTSLLDGEKYEAVPKTTSPSAPTFPESAQRPKSPSKADRGLGIHVRRKHASPSVPADKASGSVPVLSLSLPDPKLEEKKLQGLGVVFEGITDEPPRLDDEALGGKRLTPTETLNLVQTTSEIITERGLETLGVMRPHWFASPRQQEIQLKLISRFLQTLSSQQPNGAASSSAPSPAPFESELRYTRDPHDVAAVLRWGLRHLQLEGNTFGSSGNADWYRSFADSERAGSYPSKAFDDVLVPLLPVAHTQLLRAILDLVSSLAAHSEENGISGNKLSKVLGWWIVSSRNVQDAGWREFYIQWEAAARQFEHLFLAYIRTQEAQSRMPRRLTELVKNYPFAKSRREDDGIFLPRSRFSTRSASALFIKITVDKSSVSTRPHPLRIVEDAFKASAESESTGEYAALWQDIRKIATKPTQLNDESKETSEVEESTLLNLTAILADESIRLLSLVPTLDGSAGPTMSSFTPLPTGRARRSLSVGDRSPSPIANGSNQGSSKDNGRSPASPSASNRELEVTTDWVAFSSAGFRSPSGLSLAASLWDNDTEVTQPVPKKGAGAGKRNLSIKSGSPRRASVDSPRVVQSTLSAQLGRLTYGAPQIVKLDEAFIDFWADTLLDTIALTWPTFVVCQLKSIPTLRITETDKPIEWLVIERVVAESRPSPPAVKTSAASARAASPSPTSPTRSEGSKSSRWTTSTLAATRKRWSFFSPRHESAPAVQGGKDRAARKAAKVAKVGEMGEILKEEDEGKTNGVKVNGTKKEAESPKKKKKDSPKESKVPKDSEETVVPKDTETKPDAVTLPPAIQINGASKPEADVTSETVESPVIAAEPTPAIQGLAAVVEEPAEDPKTVTAPKVVQTAIQSSQPIPLVEANREPQPVIEQVAVESSVAEPVHVEEVAVTHEPTHAAILEELHAPASPVPAEEPLVEQEDEQPPPPPSKADIVPEPQPAEVQTTQAPVVGSTEEIRVPAAAEELETTETAVVDIQEHPATKAPSAPKEEEVPLPPTKDDDTATAVVPDEPEATAPAEDASAPALHLDAQDYTQPAPEVAPVEQPSADLPEAADEDEQAAEEVAVAPSGEPDTQEQVVDQPETVRAPTPEGAPQEALEAERDDGLELTEPVVKEALVKAMPDTEAPAVQAELISRSAPVEPLEEHDVATPEPEAPTVEPEPELEAIAKEHVEEPIVTPAASSDDAQAEPVVEDLPQQPEVSESYDAPPNPAPEDEPVNPEATVPSSADPPIHSEEPNIVHTEPSVDAEVTLKEDADQLETSVESTEEVPPVESTEAPVEVAS